MPSGGVTYQELRVASDGITVVTNANADVGPTDITLKQLAAVWGPSRRSSTWSQIPPPGTFNDVPLTSPARLAVGHLRLLQRGGPG